MIILESTYDGAGTIVETKTMRSGQTAADGQAMKHHTDGTLEKTANTTKPAYISASTSTSGGTVQVVAVRADQVFLADYGSTTAPTAGKNYALDSDGVKIDASSTATAIAYVKSVDTAAKKCRIQFL